MRSFYCKTRVNLWKISQKLLNDHFINVKIQKLIKTKFFNNYKTYVKMKNEIIKIQHNSFFNSILTTEWFGESSWQVMEGSLKKTKLNFSVIAVSERNQSWFDFDFSIVIGKFPALPIFQIVCMKHFYKTATWNRSSRDPQTDTLK